MAKSKQTLCVHSPGDYQGVNTPIYTSSSNKYIGYDEQAYPRYFNTVNQESIIEIISRLEGAETGLVFSSGMAAISTSLLTLLRPNDHILFPIDIYGGSFKFVTDELEKYGIEYDFIEGTDVKDYQTKIKANTKVIYAETPSNPLLSVIDLKALATLARKNNITTIVDNTFATPINQNPISFGFDIVLHSGTKYLGGHSDLCFGAVLGSKSFVAKLKNTAQNYGGSLNALDCYLIERSLKTLAVRVTKHNENAMHIAEYLKENKNISKVFYPGLKDHPNHAIAKEQMPGGFGGMLAFELGENNITAFLDSLTLVRPSLSLGGVETILCQPSLTSHKKMDEASRLKLGITNNTIRLSVGIEKVDDIIEDLEQAFRRSQ